MNEELKEIRGEIEKSLQARVEGAEVPAGENPQELAVETLPSIEEGAEEAVEPIQGDEGQEIGIKSINDLAATLGIDPEEFYRLPIRLGGDQEIPLGEAKDKLAQLEQDRQAIEQQRSELQRQTQELQTRAAQAGQAQAQLTQRQAQAQQRVAGLQAQYQAKVAEWDGRREIEPGKVALEQQEFQNAYGSAQMELQSAQQDARVQQGQAQQQWAQQQNAILTQKIPEWKDPDTRKTLQQELKQFAVDQYGASETELQRIDARTIQLLRDAMDGRKSRLAAEKALESVNSKAPLVPRTARQAVTQQRRKNVADLEKRARATGKTQDKLAAARAILGR